MLALCMMKEVAKVSNEIVKQVSCTLKPIKHERESENIRQTSPG